MTVEDGETFLHRACRNPRSTLLQVQRLVDEDPQALLRRGFHGSTPLHLACKFLRHRPAILQLLLDRSPVEVNGMCNGSGLTPLHLACVNRVTVDIIRQMLLVYPKALQIITRYGETPLHSACVTRSSSLELIKLLIFSCPAACLLLTRGNNLPHDSAVHVRAIDSDVVAVAATINAVLSFLVCLQQRLIAVPPTVITHIRQVLPGLFEEGSSLSYMESNDYIRQALRNHERLKTLLRNDELQTMLKEENCQDMIRGVYRMVEAGRAHTRRDDSKHHLHILESVIDLLPDFMYLHLRSHPTLCQRSTSGIAQQQLVSPTTEQPGGEALTVNDDASSQTESERIDDDARPTRKRKASS
jgi:ankyrin repeat protein